MITIEELRNRLAERLSETKESQNSMAKRLGIQQSTLSNFLSEKKGLGLEAALAILEDMGYVLQAPKAQRVVQEEVGISHQERIDFLTKERDALACANDALKNNVRLLEEKITHMVEKNEALQDDGRADRPASVADTAHNPTVGHSV